MTRLFFVVVIGADNASSNFPRSQPLWQPKNQDLSFFNSKTSFSTHFDSKHFQNHYKYINGLKKQKKIISKTKMNSKPKNKSSSDFFFMNFKRKKTHNMNSLYQMEPFHTNIGYFNGINRCYQYFSLSIAGIQRLLFLLFQSQTKNITKMNLTKN